MLRIAVIEDAPAMRSRLVDMLTRQVTGYDVHAATDLQSGLALVQTCRPDLVLLDLVLPGASPADLSAEHGRTILRFIRREMPRVKVIVLTSEGDRAREFLLEEGADDFFGKSSEDDWRRQSLLTQVEKLIGHVPARTEAGQDMAERLHGLSPRDHLIVIEGEAGTGKRHLGGLIHACLSAADGGPASLSVGSIPSQQLLADIVGRRGDSHEAGLLETSATVMLNGFEAIGQVDRQTQAAWAEVFATANEDGFTLSPVGHSERLRSAARVVITTRSSLAALTASGELSAELGRTLEHAYHVRVPPLRSCPEDTVEYAAYLTRLEAEAADRAGLRLSPGAVELLEAYGRTARWPGNHAELRQAIAHAVAQCDGDEIAPEHIPLAPMAEQVATREYAFVFVDVVNSKAMKLGQDAEAVRKAFDAYHKLVSDVVEDSRGEVYSTSGDGVLCRFREAEDAVRAATVLLGHLAAFNQTGNHLSGTFQLRVGISTGPAPDVEAASGGTVASETIDRAAALQECTDPDSVLACAHTVELAGSTWAWSDEALDALPGIAAHRLNR